MKRCSLVMPTMLLLGCGARVEQFVLPDQVTDFNALYNSNCAGCHGRDGRLGAARSLNDPLYLAVIGKPKLRDTIAKGLPGTAMPAFAQNAGGALTDQQITILADQIEKRWSRPQDFVGAALPPYSADPGDLKAGEAAFRNHCATCHGESGTGGSKAGSVVDPNFLALASDQSLRTTVIAGCNQRQTTTPQEISDIVAWLSAHRIPTVTLTQRKLQ